MRAPKSDHQLAALESAADRAHLEQFYKGHVDQRTKAVIAAALNRCIEATTDLERFLGHAAAATRTRTLHHTLYDAAKVIGDLPLDLQSALRSVDAFVDTGGTTRGAMRRAEFEAEVALRGRADTLILQETEDAFIRAIATYDQALAHIVKAPSGFVDLLTAQRRVLSRLHREIARLRARE